jgi:DNA invertase Pin-like site-specific DNA recombinase
MSAGSIRHRTSLPALSRGGSSLVLDAVQDMLLRPAPQVARDAYEHRRERQREGIDLGRQNGKAHTGFRGVRWL